MPQPKQTAREEVASKHPNSWIPILEGDTLTGEVTHVGKGWSDVQDSFYPILGVTPDGGGEVMVHAFHTALANEIIGQRPLPGERVTITYRGQGEARVRGQSGAFSYRVRVHGRSAESYDRLYDSMTPKGRAGKAQATEPAQSVEDAPASEADKDNDPLPY